MLINCHMFQKVKNKFVLLNKNVDKIRKKLMEQVINYTERWKLFLLINQSLIIEYIS